MTRSIFRRACVAIVAISVVGSASSLAKGDDNLASNFSFEEPPGAEGSMPNAWTYFTSKDSNARISSDDQFDGGQSLKITAQSLPDAYQGINQKIAVAPKQKYSFSAQVRNDKEDQLGGGIKGVLVIEWLDPAGNQIAREESKPWNRNLSRLKWSDYEIRKAKAPEGAVEALFGIHIFEEGQGGKGSLYVDDIRVVHEQQ